MRHKLCRSFHPWCPGVKNRCLLDTFGVRIWQWIYVAFIWHPGIWQHDRNNIVTTNAQNNYILFEFCPSITNESWTDMHAELTQAPTCWQLAGETRLAAKEVSDTIPAYWQSEMCSERDSPLKRLYRRTHAKLTRLAGSGQLVWAAGCELSLVLVHARRPAWPGETSETILRVAPPR